MVRTFRVAISCSRAIAMARAKERAPAKVVAKVRVKVKEKAKERVKARSDISLAVGRREGSALNAELRIVVDYVAGKEKPIKTCIRARA